MQNVNSDDYLAALGFVQWVNRDRSSTSLDEAPEKRTGSTADFLQQLAARVESCRKCSLYSGRRNSVCGEGHPEADWLFIGEAPGAEEDRLGVPFVGRAGQLLNSMIIALDLTRTDTYITNVLKCRPPENRNPKDDEVQECELYLHQQIEFIRPRIIVALGKFAAQTLLKSSKPIGKLRGDVHSYSQFNIPLIATYHPAYLLRSPIEKRKVWQDLVLAKSSLT
ncbi:MAG: uracil-DNA glycosylase [Acidiferrobacteraceae bacterium]|nr:uracil-DNA glycosylase [Acidiferrobacteraceae bacterium]